MYFILNPLRSCILQAVFLSVWMDLTGGIDIQLIPQYPAVGQTVTLSVNGITGSLRQVTWYKGSSTDSSNQIFNYVFTNPPTQTNGTQYFSRAKALTNGSLQISQLTKEDHGNYTVQIQTGASQQLSVYLPVYEIVTKPTIKPSSNYPKENETFALECETSNANSIMWKKDSASLPSGVTLLQGNKTLNFSKIKLSDEGKYECTAVNPVSNSTSDIYILTVNYGPVNMSIDGSLHMQVGSVLSLKCSSNSVPIAIYSWLRNGTLSEKDILNIQQAKLEDQGEYTCRAYNSITQLSANRTVYVNVTKTDDTSSPDKPLDGGVIAGIVIAAIVLIIALIIALTYLLVIRKKHAKTSSNMDQKPISFVTGLSGNGQTDRRGTAMEEPEIQYSSLDFRPKEDRKMQPVPESTVYAEVKRS
ncbi:cell adhesion molecule CEACAM8-like isoform 1-T1 [Discoglossus pictus]